MAYTRGYGDDGSALQVNSKVRGIERRGVLGTGMSMCGASRLAVKSMEWNVELPTHRVDNNPSE